MAQPDAVLDLAEDRIYYWPDSVKRACRKLVVEQGLTIERAAAKSAVPADTVRNWSLAEEWVTLRREHSARELALLKAKNAAPIAIEAPQVISDAEADHAGGLATIKAQIARVDKMILDDDLTPDQLTKLVAAKANLWGLIHHRPGPMKPSRKRGKVEASGPLPPDPLLQQPDPQPPVN